MLIGDDRAPDEVALDDLVTTRTWAELEDRAVRLAGVLRGACGLAPGDHLAMLAGNRVEVVEVVLASLLSGVWLTPLSTHLTSSEIGYVLDDCGARLLLTEDRFGALVDEILDVAQPEVVRFGDELDTLVGEASDAPPAEDVPPGGTMFYTSGTTGRPKGVRRARQRSLRAQLGMMVAAGRALGLDGTGPHLVTGPLFHAAPMGFALMDLVCGAPLVLMPRFDASQVLDLIGERGVHHTHLVPTMCVRMLRLPDDERARFDPSSLRTVLHGAAPIAPAVKHAMIEWWGPVLVEYWGASEGGVVTLVDSQEWLERPGTVGRPVATYEVVVTDPDGRLLPPGEVGKLWCRHRSQAHAFEYHRDPDKTARAFLDERTYSIGDLGWVDDDGYVFLADRESHMIITGGMNVYPAEVEAALVEHPGVVDVAVFGIPDDEWGESVMAVVEVAPGRSVDAGELLAIARQRLASYKVPRRVELTDSLPRHDNGKLAIRQLREPYWRDRERAI